ncbi:MAG: acetamidase/formamidase family protein [Rhodothermales bacterium]
MARHVLEPQRATLHGQFSRDLTPALIINSGDTVCYRTIDVTWGIEQHGAPGTPRRRFEPRELPRDDGPALCGPVAIRGAMPGMTLEVRIDVVEPVSWGWTYAGPSFFNAALHTALGLAEEEKALIRWTLDAETMVGVSEHGHRLKLRPFLGTIGLSPKVPGLHSGWLPGRTGGNIDCKELVAGSRLYLPIEVPDGLVSVGDGHAVQGDGEVGGSAIECPMERVELRYVVRDDMRIGAPRAYTPVGWITFGFGERLDDAIAMALNEMLDLMQAQYALARPEALALASVVVDVRITQLVNGVRGVHAVLPDGAIQEGPIIRNPVV